jgi:hypothetical protein
MEDTWQANAGRSRFSKALPVPPPNPSYDDESRRGKANPFPSAQRALPPAPKLNIASTIPRRPVGGQNNSKEPSIASISPAYSESPKALPNYQALVKKLESMETMEAGKTPPPPPKDKGKHPLPDVPQEPTHLHSNSTSSTASSANASSPRSEIWRRRSVKSDRSGSITELKLTKSNGFTTSPPLVNPSSPLPVAKNSLPPLPSQPARPVVGLPGRDIKPARPAPPQPDAMGSKISKILKPESKGSLPSADESKFRGRPTNHQLSPIKRLPTPDYQSTDTRFQQPPASQALPLASPETPPSDLSPELGQDHTFLGEHISSSGPQKPRNDLKLLPSVRATEPVETVTRGPSPPRSSQPQKPELPSILAIKRPPSRNTEALSPEEALPGTPDCFPPAALSTIHFDCYQSHRQMRGSRNDVCPVACMVCEVKDAEKRWMCTWCSLRCCDPCMKGLTDVPGKDLRKCLEWIGRKDRIINTREASAVN